LKRAGYRGANSRAGRAFPREPLDHYRRRAREQARPGLVEVEVEVTAPMAWGRGSGLALVGSVQNLSHFGLA